MFVPNNSNLAFIESLNIKAFPCGRRRSQLIDKDDPSTVGDKYSIPFDPEARLNTEANNRKHSSLNGYTQTYLDKWDAGNKTLSLVLAGYLFNIDLKDIDSQNQQGQINSFISNIPLIDNATKVYANIRIEEVSLFSDGSSLNYTTGVLRNQTETKSPEVCLDLPTNDLTVEELTSAENYFFSGLSFTTSPIAKHTEDDEYKYVLVSTDETRGVLNIYKNAQIHQQVVSLCILDKVNTEWKIHEPARLPKIEHGDTENSIKVGDISSTGSISAEHISCNGIGVAQFDLTPIKDNGNTYYQLQFTKTT